MEKIIKIYLSSDNDLLDDVKQVTDFISEFSSLLERNYNTSLKVLVSEKNQGYEELIPQSDLCVFLCSDENEESISDEMDYASSVFKYAIKDKAFVFFKRPDNAKVHFYLVENDVNASGILNNSFLDSIDSIKFRIICAVKFRFMEYLDIEQRKGICFVEGKEFLNIDNLPEFKNCAAYIDLKDRFEKAEAEYLSASCDCDENGVTQEKRKELLSQKHKYKRDFNRLRRRIFNLSLNMVKYSFCITETYPQNSAYGNIFKGDYTEALKYLRSDVLKYTYHFYADNPSNEEAKDMYLKDYLYNTLAAINIHPIESNSLVLNLDVDAAFEELLPLALTTISGTEFVFRYIEWAYSVSCYTNAISAFKDFCSSPFWEKISVTQKAEFYKVMADVYKKVEDKRKAEECLLQQLLMYNSLRNTSEAYLPGFAQSFLDLGEFYYDGNEDKAMEHLKAAEEIFRELSRKNPERFITLQAYSIFRMGYITEEKSYFKKALKLAEKYPEHPVSVYIIDAITRWLN